MPASLPILNQPQHEHFSAARELETRLRATLRGEARFDLTSRALYTTDASNYRQVPIGIITPHDADDVIAAVEICRSLSAPILARGAGTSLAGQTCNTAVVFDFSKHMRRLHSLDPQNRSATVEPGIVLDRVREAAELHNLTFAPDPATHSRCTLGGMIGNNSCGTHALMGGKTVDNIRALDVLLYDGTRLTVGPTSDDQYRAILQRGGRTAQIYQGMRQLVDHHADEIRRRFPRIPRRVSGYNLDQLLPENGFHVARALVGSEGTLATILSATLDLVHSPPCRRLVVLGFPDAFLAADAVPAILENHPIGLEGIDSTLLEGMRRKNLAHAERKMLPAGNTFLLVEFGASTDTEVDVIAHDFRSAAQSIPHALQAAIFSGEDAARIWRVRESALGATVFVPGLPHQWEGWEDAAVPPARLGEYLRKLFTLMREYGYTSPLYGHFGQGCVHMRMNFDFESEPGLQAYRSFIDRAADLVVSLGGSLSGEHGDGQSRAALLPKMFGPQIMQAFRDFKRLWDPENRMNPGKLISAETEIYQPTDNLRVGPGYQPAHPETHFSFDRDHGSFGEATLRCVGVGACRKTDSGVMCPSYMATREEQHSTRGRAHLLWEMLQGNLLQPDWNNEGVKQALDLCLSCKACKSECPVSVDMASWKAEFLAHYHETQPRELRHYLFGFMDRWAALAATVPGLSQRIANLPLQIPPIQSALKSILGIAPQRRLPQFAPRTFQQQWRAQNASPSPTLPQAILWPDTWNNYYHPQSLTAAGQILHTAGYAVQVPRQHVCCGRPLYDFGFLDAARNYLRRILTQFAPQIDAALPVIFLEPSCASVLRNELLDFFPRDERARRLADQTLLLSQFLTRYAPHYQPAQHPNTRIVLHGHCHHKAVFNMEDELAWLRRTGAQVELLDAGCCGMAGPFGFEREKFEVSQTLAERVLLPAVRNAAPADILVTDGFSCREQITQNTPRHAHHFAEVLCNPNPPSTP
ncbi:MAG: FAD-binding and (Fe-S)-binding domain-containing protein [Acidobacteriaceae bacterium]